MTSLPVDPIPIPGRVLELPADLLPTFFSSSELLESRQQKRLEAEALGCLIKRLGATLRFIYMCRWSHETNQGDQKIGKKCARF